MIFEKLKVGDFGKEVVRLHEALKGHGFDVSAQEIKRKFFGPDTRKVIHAYQNSIGLEATGQLDPMTIKALDLTPTSKSSGSNSRVIRSVSDPTSLPESPVGAPKRLADALVEAKDEQTYKVQGVVLEEDGEPVQRMKVIAFDRGLRKERPLGEGTTDTAGHYEIIYKSDSERLLSLGVKAIDANGKVLKASSVVFGPKPIETIDLVLGEVLRGPSEYTQLERQLIPHLEEVNPADLTADEAEHLAKKLELDLRHLGFYVLSAQIATESRLPREALYGLFRQGLPTRLPALLAQDQAVLKRTLVAAVDANIIPKTVSKSFDDVLDRMQALIVKHAFKKPDVTGKFSLNDLLNTTRLSRQQQEDLLSKYVRHKGSIEVFWEELRNDPKFGAERVEEAQFALQLGALTNNHLPLNKAILNRRIKSTRELTRFKESDWLEMIKSPLTDGGIVGTPPDIQGETADQKQKNYAKVISAIVEDAFPTTFLARRLDEDEHAPLEGKKDLVAFIENNPEFEFGTSNVDKYLREKPDALRGAGDADALKKNLKTMKRLFAVAPNQNRYQTIKPLLQSGLTSALGIERMGSGFEKEFASKIGENGAKRVYRKAVQRAAVAQTLFFQFSPAMLHGTPKAILGDQAVLPAHPDIPNWETLFGSLDLCACEHCQSIHGPAAYLVDILVFVKNQGISQGLRSNSRRADIYHIELSCKNTSTPLPYIDLVNEILENAISSPGTAYQTNGPAQELRAAAEHRNDDAYDEIAKAVYPWILPFSLPHEEAWRYLEHLGLKRYRLMEIFQNEGKDADSSQPSVAEVAADHLGLTPTDRDIITGNWTGAGPKPTLQKFWGKPNLSDPALRSQLAHVEIFLQQAGLIYTQLLELMSTSYINTQGNMNINFLTPGCDLNKAQIVPPFAIGSVDKVDILDRIHRFERLRRKLRWSFYDLDRAITALPPETLNDAFIINLSDIERLREELRVPLVEMLSWWGIIDTKDYLPEGAPESLSLYQKVFQNKVVFDKNILAVFHLNALANNELDLVDHLSSIASVLRINANDLDSCIKALSNQKFNLENLSQLYRIASLAKALSLPITQFLTLQTLSGIDPFTSPAETRRFLVILNKVRSSGFSIPLLEVLLWNAEAPPLKTAPKDDEVVRFLDELRTGLQKIKEEISLPPDTNDSTLDPEGDLTQQKLALILDNDMLKRAMALISGAPKNQPADLAAFIDQRLPFLDSEDAIKKLIGQNGSPPELDPENRAERFAYVLTPLLKHLNRALGTSFVIQTTATAMGVPVQTAERLLSTLLNSVSNNSESLIDDFLNETFVGSGNKQLTRTDFETQFNAFTRLWKTTTIVSILRINSDEIAWIAAHHTRLDLLDFNALPFVVQEGEVLPTLFPDLARLIDLILLRDGLPPGEPNLSDILDIALTFNAGSDNANEAKQRFIAKLHERTGWDLETLRFLSGGLLEIAGVGLGLSFPKDYGKGHAVRRLEACIKALKLVGGSPRSVQFEWKRPRLSAEGARSIKAAVKAKYDSMQWLAIAQSINDVLREKQRDALASHLIAIKPEFNDFNDLYGHYLIDPEMSACMMTSRIKQAISSVQLYIQRVLLRLEGENVDISPKGVDDWLWMKLYRVWEANRKIFLYPENWIEPELRDDKSPFFKELESELLQNELTNDTVETALGHYLEKLEEVARLEVCGIYTEPDTEIHHVFARTRAIPYIYYKRCWVFPKYWTPWERVDADIEGDHLIPVMFNRRLYLFWPVFSEKVKESPPPKEGEEAQPPPKYLSVKLARSEYRSGSWSAKKISSLSLTNDVSKNKKAGYFQILDGLF